MKTTPTTQVEQAILEAAEELFAERGYAATSTVDIAKRAGCKQPMVHYYFRSKERLFESIFEMKAAMFMSFFLAIADQEVGFLQKASRLVEAHFDFLMQQPRIPFLLLNELSTNPGRIDSMRSRVGSTISIMTGRLEAELEAEFQKGTIRHVSVRDLIFTVVSLNASVFLGGPILQRVTQLSDEALHEFYMKRRSENVTLVQRFLQP